jgi:hypothetical protein
MNFLEVFQVKHPRSGEPCPNIADRKGTRGSLRFHPKENRIAIEPENGTAQTYDPRRLSGVSVHREAEREFSMTTTFSSLRHHEN